MINADKMNCCGCGICAEGCPAQAIEMKPDEDGFLYPVVNHNKCINCSKCDRICAFNNLNGTAHSSKTFVARHKSTTICKNSTSGGMYTAISDIFLANGGVVYSPMFDSEMILRHQRILDTKARDVSRGSKYVQSDLCSSLAQILEDLKNSRSVVFFGTPCQVAAVKSFVPHSLQKALFTIDIVCNGVGSPMFWWKHKEKLENEYHARMTNYVFRPKKHGYLTQTELAVFEDLGEKEIVSDLDRYNVIYYSRLIMRPCCSNCKFCSTKRISDITISDYSKEERRSLPFKSEYGVSSLLINTDKGNALFYKFEKDIDYKEVDNETIQQIRLMKCESSNSKSAEFLKICRESGINAALRYYFGFAKRVKIKIKEIFRRMVL